MPSSEDAGLPRHLGDYPDGAYWSAERHAAPSADDPADHTVSGSVIGFAWDYGVRVPLWDAEGLLPEEPAWLRDTLGLSEQLVDDLTRWGLAMDELDADPVRRTAAAYEALDEHARALVQRLTGELGSRFSVTYRPW